MQATRYPHKWLTDEELTHLKPNSGDNPLLKAFEARRKRRRIA